MRVEDVYSQNRRLWVRLHEKGGKEYPVSYLHNLETYLHDNVAGAGLTTGHLTGAPLPKRTPM